VLDHIGFDVKDLPAFIKKIEAEGVKLDEPYRKIMGSGAASLSPMRGARASGWSSSGLREDRGRTITPDAVEAGSERARELSVPFS
jgi:hypothetical protein